MRVTDHLHRIGLALHRMRMQATFHLHLMGFQIREDLTCLTGRLTISATDKKKKHALACGETTSQQSITCEIKNAFVVELLSFQL